MRITFVLPYAGMSGGVRVVAIYAQRLQARGHEVQVISIPKAAPNVRQKVRSLLRGQGWPGQSKGPSHFDGLGGPPPHPGEAPAGGG